LSFPVMSSIFSIKWCLLYSHVSRAFLCHHLCIKRCPALVSTFNHSHEFSQFRLALNPAMFTNSEAYMWIAAFLNPIPPESTDRSSTSKIPTLKCWHQFCRHKRKTSLISSYHLDSAGAEVGGLTPVGGLSGWVRWSRYFRSFCLHFDSRQFRCRHWNICSSRVTRRVYEKIGQIIAQRIFSQN
jgi:hypothetical protein